MNKKQPEMEVVQGEEAVEIQVLLEQMIKLGIVSKRDGGPGEEEDGTTYTLTDEAWDQIHDQSKPPS
jgi:hypothetical protein